MGHCEPSAVERLVHARLVAFKNAKSKSGQSQNPAAVRKRHEGAPPKEAIQLRETSIRPCDFRIWFSQKSWGLDCPNVVDLEAAQHVPSALLKYSNTAWDAKYRKYCADKGLDAHPARMQTELVSFFVEFLTDRRDFVFDPFGGSNTTGAVAEKMGRRWMTVEAEANYVAGSVGRFEDVVSRKR